MDPSRRRFFGSHLPCVAPFRPPWSVPEACFVDACSRCDDCVRACPTGLLQRGDSGFPLADFSAAACSFCGDCANACKTGAIAPDTSRVPWQFTICIGESCLAHQRVECRVCGEMCEPRAILFPLMAGGVLRPEVDSAVCTGCGACLAPCPVNAIKRVAREPQLLVRSLSSLSMELP